MRISQSTRIRAAEAARVFARTGNLSETSRETGIHRSTLDRWKNEGLLESSLEQVQAQELSLDSLVEKALRVIDQALDGEKVTPSQIRSAIEVLKGSNALRAQQRAEEAQQSLAELIALESPGD